MSKRFSGRVVAITGAASGIGRAAALELARGQASLVLTGRRQAALERLASECEAAGASAIAVAADVSDHAAVENVARQALERFGRIDVWLNNAAVTLFGRLEDVPYEAIRRVIDTNLIVGLSECLRMELVDAPGIHVCTVLPASIDTPLFQHGANYTGLAVKPLRPVYAPELVARAIANAAERPRREIVAGNAGRAALAVHSLAGGLSEKLGARRVAKDHFQQRHAAPTAGNLFEPDMRYETASGGWRPARGSKLPVIIGGLFSLGLAVLVASRFRRGHAQPRTSTP